MNRDEAIAMLKLMGYEVIGVDNPPDAVRYYAHNQFGIPIIEYWSYMESYAWDDLIAGVFGGQR